MKIILGMEALEKEGESEAFERESVCLKHLRERESFERLRDLKASVK